MAQIKIENQKLIDYLEGLSYEVAARRDVITFMLANKMDIRSEQFQAYHKEYMEFFVQLESAKAQLEKDYVRPNIKGKAEWNLDYGTRLLTIVEAGA